MNYKEIQEIILKVLEATKFCVLATANKKGVVSASQMCLVNDGLTVFFQTDSAFEKIQNIKENPHVAINCGAYYFKGLAKIVGHPTKNKLFIEKLKEKHLPTYEHYTNLANEVLIEIKLIECKIWGVNKVKNVNNQETILVVDLVSQKTKEIVCDKM